MVFRVTSILIFGFVFINLSRFLIEPDRSLNSWIKNTVLQPMNEKPARTAILIISPLSIRREL